MFYVNDIIEGLFYFVEHALGIAAESPQRAVGSEDLQRKARPPNDERLKENYKWRERPKNK